jgi:hypothetical protein
MSSSTEPLFSYLEIDGTVYTVTELIWVNDIYNHSQYGKIYNNFVNLNIWRKAQKEIIDKEIRDKQKSFIIKYKQDFLNDFENIKKTVDDNIKKIPTTNTLFSL